MKVNVVLRPREVAEICFLWEALDWLAFSKFPLHDGSMNGPDVRLDSDTQEEYEAYVPEDEILTSEDCLRVGLEPDPEFEAMMKGEDYRSVELYENMLASEIDKKGRERLEKEYEQALEYYAKKKQWDEEYEAYMEVPKSKLFVALREGRISAYGRKLPFPKVEEMVESLDETQDTWHWADFEHISMPTDCWRYEAINWDYSVLTSENNHFNHIYVDTEQLFSEFPPIISEATQPVKAVGGNYLLQDGMGAGIIIRKKGRPAFDWDGFYQRVFEKAQANEIPEKLESFVAEMQEWCLHEWRREVGRSTVLQKLSPIHKRHFT